MKAYTHEECSVYTHAKIRQKHIFTYKHHLDACPPPQRTHTHDSIPCKETPLFMVCVPRPCPVSAEVAWLGSKVRMNRK